MPEQKIVQDPIKNAYQVGIAHRLKIDPKRVNVIVRTNPKGGMLVHVAVDGRDLNASERRLVDEYWRQEIPGSEPVIVDEKDVSTV